MATFHTHPVEGGPEAIPVALHRREGATLYVRPLEPGESAAPISYDPLLDSVVLMIAVMYGAPGASDDAGGQTTPPIRVVYDGEDGDVVFVRTLRVGEADTARPVYVKPGQRIDLKPNAFIVHLDVLDSQLVADSVGYAPLTHTVWSWLSLGMRDKSGRELLYVLAAARRLDAAAAAWTRVKDGLEVIRTWPTDTANPAVRARSFALVADLELAMIALRRVIAMVMNAEGCVGIRAAIPAVISVNSRHVKAIRDSFEHIDERALGSVRGASSPDAASIFRQGRLASEGVVSYGSHELSIETVDDLLSESRSFIKTGIVELVGTDALTPRR